MQNQSTCTAHTNGKKALSCSGSPKADDNDHIHNKRSCKEVEHGQEKRQKRGNLKTDGHPLPEGKALENLICPLTHVRVEKNGVLELCNVQS